MNYSIAGNQHHSNTYFLDPLITEAKKKKKEEERRRKKENKSFCFHSGLVSTK